jgi:hypothetical protein
MEAIKAGARHNAADNGMIQTIHDHAASLGAVCGATKAGDLFIAPGSTIKAVGSGKIQGYLVRYTSPAEPDLVGDFFDARTDFGLKDGATLPLYYHHNLDPELRGPLGSGEITATKEGLWFAAVLRMRSAYEKFLYRLVEMGKAGFSSGADPSTVVRQQVKAGVFRVARWKLVEGSITATPMDAGNVVSIKSLMAGPQKDAYARRRDALLYELQDIEIDLELDEEEAEREAARRKRRDTLDPALLRPGPGSGEMIDLSDRWGIRR